MASAVEPASVHYEDVAVNSIAGAGGEKCHRAGKFPGRAPAAGGNVAAMLIILPEPRLSIYP